MLEIPNIMATYNDNTMHDALMQVYTGFFGKITELSDECKTATIQPLHMAKQNGADAIQRSLIKQVPVLFQARYRIIEEDRECTINGNQGCGEGGCSCTTETRKHLKKEWIKVGDIAYCVCADRDISQTKNGEMAVPIPGHHELKDAVVVGVLP